MPAEIIDETAPACAGGDGLHGQTQQPSSQGTSPPRGAGQSLAQAAEAVLDVVLEAVGRSTSEVVVVLAGDERVRELNCQWRGKDQSTDVLSFSQLEGEAMAGETELLGDIVVSVDTLRRQARDGGWSDEEELARLLVHGLLHLLGYDHEQEDDEREMKAQEARLIGALRARAIACAWDEGPR